MEKQICWIHNIDCGYRCCHCWGTGIMGLDSPYEGDCSCIDEGIWEIDNPVKWEEVL